MNVRYLPTALFILLTSGGLLLAWLERDEFWYHAEEGLGYAFGIVGSTMMVLLLLYPARKYWKPMRNMFKVHHWFRMHMIFGVLGPCFVILHSNFNLGSLNSSIALFSMLLVAGSGLIGRYVYQQLHRGLYGEQISFSDLASDYQLAKVHFQRMSFLSYRSQELLTEIESQLTLRIVPLNVSFFARIKINAIRKQSQISVSDDVEHSSDSRVENEDLSKNMAYLNAGLLSLKKMASYAWYARLFSMWHVFHLPIFFMMVIAAIVHIFVVHIY